MQKPQSSLVKYEASLQNPESVLHERSRELIKQ